MGRYYLLRKDIYSTGHNEKHKSILYGRADEKVRLISEHEDVLIVESMDAVRFAVRRENVTEHASSLPAG